LASEKELRLDIENARLRQLLAQAGIDAAEHELVEGLQRLLLEELHHRIKNLLATVMAITSQSLENADSVEHGREAIEHRLRALGRVHDLLLKVNWESASLSSIIQTAIEPFYKDSRFSIQSPDIEVSPSAVLPLAMILNELCTNAVKYGARQMQMVALRYQRLLRPRRRDSSSDGRRLADRPFGSLRARVLERY
jgi:two-component sensor histidine kinase